MFNGTATRCRQSHEFNRQLHYTHCIQTISRNTSHIHKQAKASENYFTQDDVTKAIMSNQIIDSSPHDQLIHRHIQNGLNARRNHDSSIMVAVDMSKTFDTVNPSSSNYLRKTCVYFRGPTSKFRKVEQWDPQRGVLAPQYVWPRHSATNLQKSI